MNQPAKAAKFPPRLTGKYFHEQDLWAADNSGSTFPLMSDTVFISTQEVEAMLAAERDKVKERLDALEVAMINYRRGLLTILSNCPDRKTYSKYRWIAEEWLQTGDRSKAVAEGSK